LKSRSTIDGDGDVVLRDNAGRCRFGCRRRRRLGRKVSTPLMLLPTSMSPLLLFLPYLPHSSTRHRLVVIFVVLFRVCRIIVVIIIVVVVVVLSQF
jgi:hypothetical protein